MEFKRILQMQTGKQTSLAVSSTMNLCATITQCYYSDISTPNKPCSGFTLHQAELLAHYRSPEYHLS